MTPLLYLAGVVLFVVGLAVSIGLHECGHMVPAKRFGVRVPQFFVGFGRTVWSTRRGDTEYGVKAFPLGGFVKLVGMLPPRPDGAPQRQGGFARLIADAREADRELVRPGDEDRMFYRLTWWKKVVVMFGGPLVNLVLAFLLFGSVFAIFGVPQASTTIDRVADCVVAVRPGETPPACTAADPASPAKQAGLREGDRVVEVDGTAITSYDQLQRLIRANGQRTIDITVVRDGERLVVPATTQVNDLPSLDPADAGKLVSVGYLGITPVQETVRQGPVFTVRQMGTYTVETAKALAGFPAKLWGVAKAAVGIEERDPNGPVSVVGVSRIAGEVASEQRIDVGDKVASLLMLLGGVNLFVGMFNLVPLTPLDGGRIAGALYEGVRNGVRRLRGKTGRWYFDEAPLLPLTYTIAGLILVMSVLLMYADIVAPVST